MIHPSALIDPKAELADDVSVGAYSIIGPGVRIDSGSWVGPHVVLTGRTTIGKKNRIFQFTSIGEEPQDMKYAGEDTKLIIGDNNYIRESCTFNRGTVQGGGVTRVCNNNWIMACVHIAHDCQLGNNIVMANNASLAGHVRVGDYAILGGYALIHQFCDVGEHSFTSFASHVNQSIPPFITVAGEKARARGVNSEGLKRRGYTNAQINLVRRAYRILYREGKPLDKAKKELQDIAASSPEVRTMVEFLELSERSIIR